MNSLFISATAMMVQQTGIEVTANNIANVNTTAYRKRRAEFTDLLYRQIHKDPIKKQPLQSKMAYDVALKVPNIVEVGVGARLSGVKPILIKGSLNKTENQLDIAINGNGYFVVYDENGRELYTRDGSLKISRDGRLVTYFDYGLGFNNTDIFIPKKSVRIEIDEEGVVSSFDRNSIKSKIGQIRLAAFINEGGLRPIGNNSYSNTADSGEAIIGIAKNLNFGEIVQGALESSNVDPIAEITALISMQRVYEFCSKVMTATDEMMKKVANMN